MSNKNLFKEAIADAKAVREAALANAKAALEEALTPKLQSMLAAKLNEMDYEENEGMDSKESEDEMEEGFTTSHGDDSDENLDFNLEEDFDLSEILAELDDEKEMEEAKKKKLNKGGHTGSLKDKDEKSTLDTARNDTAYSKLGEAKEESEESEEGSEEEQSVADMTIEDLKALIQDIVNQEAEAEEAETPADEEAEEKSMDMDDEEKSDEESDEIDLEELLAELDALGEAEDKDETMEEAKKKAPKKEKEEEKKEMNEAIRTINILRSELNEVNLLNAKLLYVNKIFKAKNLSESQKLQVIASFDKATTAKEAKIVYESLQSNLTAAPARKAIKESMGFASKAAGNAPRKSIVETDAAITRMQKLANIIK